MREEQFKKFFEAHNEGLYVYAFTLVKDRAEAMDVVQSSFIKLWEKGMDTKDQGAARAFLYTIVYRLSLNTIRNLKTREHHHRQLKVHDVMTAPTVEEKELRLKIEETVSELPERCREVFVKVRMEGMKYKDVALEMNISEKTVETQMLRAMKFLRQRLADAIVAIIVLMNEIINR